MMVEAGSRDVGYSADLRAEPVRNLAARVTFT